MILGLEQYGLAMQVAAVVVPAAVYFLMLGLLNSQRHPQLIKGRTDFILLNAAFLPIFFVPVVSYLGASSWALLGTVAALLSLARLLAPRRVGNWVVYNITVPEGLRAAERALRAMGIDYRRDGRRLCLPGQNATIRFSAIPLLRNVSISSDGPESEEFSRDFEALLGEQLALIPTCASPTAAAFLLIAVAMLVTPLGLLADRMPEMVRLITNLVR